MDKQRLLDKLERAWAAFNDACAGLSESRMLEPGVTEDWSVKDILAHVSWWEAEALKYLPQILQGGRTPRYSALYGGIDAFNAQMTELKRGLSLAEVQEQLAATHRALLAYLQSVPEERLAAEPRFLHRLRQDTYGHYSLHERALREWKEKG